MNLIYLNDEEYRRNWFDNVMKELGAIIGQFHRRYLENKKVSTPLINYDNMPLPELETLHLNRPTLKLYKGKHGGASTYALEDNIIRLNLNGMTSEAEFVSDVVHELTHYVMDMVYEQKLNYKNNIHNKWFWLMYASIMDYFGIEGRYV